MRQTTSRPAGADMIDPDIADALGGVLDPELGINIVDFGLVYRAEWTGDGIVVALGVATTCPATGLLVEEATAALRRRFPDVRDIRVELDTSRPWCPERMTDAGRLALGWVEPTPAKKAADAVRAPRPERRRITTAILPRMSKRWKN